MRKKPITLDVVNNHVLVPKHVKCPEAEVKEVLRKYQCSKADLPRIIITDPAIVNGGFEAGDVVRIERQSPTAGLTYYYRVVINA